MNHESNIQTFPRNQIYLIHIKQNKTRKFKIVIYNLKAAKLF